MLKQEEAFFFNWEDLYGESKEKLKDFLYQQFYMDWIKKAIVSEQGPAIIEVHNVNYEHSITVELKSSNQLSVIAYINDDSNRTYEFDVKQERGKLRLYQSGCLISDVVKSALEETEMDHDIAEYNIAVFEANQQVPDQVDGIVTDILEEVKRVSEKVGPYHSVHEGYAVMLKEFGELWDEVKRKDKNYTKMYSEAKQVACTAIRFMELVEKRKHDNNIL